MSEPNKEQASNFITTPEMLKKHTKKNRDTLKQASKASEVTTMKVLNDGEMSVGEVMNELEKKLKELEKRIECLERQQRPLRVVGTDLQGKPLVIHTHSLKEER